VAVSVIAVVELVRGVAVAVGDGAARVGVSVLVVVAVEVVLGVGAGVRVAVEVTVDVPVAVAVGAGCASLTLSGSVRKLATINSPRTPMNASRPTTGLSECHRRRGLSSGSVLIAPRLVASAAGSQKSEIRNQR
jgi:hypothetical protein